MILRMLMNFLGEENFLNGIKVAFARQIVFTLKNAVIPLPKQSSSVQSETNHSLIFSFRGNL